MNVIGSKMFAMAAASALVMSVGLTAAASAQTATPDPIKGRSVFAKCGVCHSLEPGVTKIGPSLAGVVGRKSGSLPNFNYSPAMKASNVVWTPENLDRYLTSPRLMVPGNRMIFPGLPDPADRMNVIAYLKSPEKFK